MALPIKNPYSHMNNLIRKIGKMDNPEGIFSAKITSLSPFTIESGDLQVDADNILIADFLLPNHQVSYQVGDMTYTATLKNMLSVGDYVAVMPTTDDQTYFVLCKVVAPNG